MWRIENLVGYFGCDAMQCRLDLSRPELGVCGLLVPPSTDPAFFQRFRLLRLEVDGESLDDVYIRGDDLVARFHQVGEDSCRYEFYWRVLLPAASLPSVRVTIELIASVQTNSLDADPQLRMISEVPTGETVKNGLFVGGEDEEACAFLQIAHPSNLDQTVIETDGKRARIHHYLFPGRLEKGVIRRARIRAIFLSPEATSEIAGRLDEQFNTSLPPLTV